MADLPPPPPEPIKEPKGGWYWAPLREVKPKCEGQLTEYIYSLLGNVRLDGPIETYPKGKVPPTTRSRAQIESELSDKAGQSVISLNYSGVKFCPDGCVTKTLKTETMKTDLPVLSHWTEDWQGQDAQGKTTKVTVHYLARGKADVEITIKTLLCLPTLGDPLPKQFSLPAADPEEDFLLDGWTLPEKLKPLPKKK
ncbi:MAG: hypothetical protein AAFR27_11585 [Pseudomonadota bacterium]